jgi:DNA-binding NtrC family response regulator
MQVKAGRIRTVDAAALDHLSAYPWPGNVRQLENAVERMVVLAGGAVLQRTDVPEEVLNWRADDAELVVDGEGFREARCSFERHFLCSALPGITG